MKTELNIKSISISENFYLLRVTKITGCIGIVMVACLPHHCNGD